MKIFTLGFTHKSAEAFFPLLSSSGVKRVVDVRLNNVSQLAGFAKKNDLKYFLLTICGMDYIHSPVLAPTQEMLDAYKKEKGDWIVYEKKFQELLRERAVESVLDKSTLSDACLLCSEATPERCHRRLVAEYLREKWGGIEIVHL
jgi:uncharacterized protein (DUF488 family)